MNQLVQIGRIKHLLDRKTPLLLINSFVFSKLFYCSSVWGNTSKCNLHKVQLVQNFFSEGNLLKYLLPRSLKLIALWFLNHHICNKTRRDIYT